jgi:peptidoglycan/xylan/chitin deacetylase (PgdA/CDA1 family)
MENTLWKIFALFLILSAFSSQAAVILQYHHVSDKTPGSTSITPQQFLIHLQYLQDNKFNVVPLSALITAMQSQRVLPDKTVAITFDDAYLDNLMNAKPLLDKFDFPYTIFVNPGIINRNENKNKSQYLSWQQLKALAEEGVIIANHGFEHDSLLRIPDGLSKTQWFSEQTALLLKAEALIKQKTGHSWRYFAYPYGEYDIAVQAWVKANNFMAFSQQSGAVNFTTDLTSIPRFPVSQPYDKVSSLRDKLNSLAFTIKLEGKQAKTVFNRHQAQEVTFTVETSDFYKSSLNCYVSGLGKQKITWHGDQRFTLKFSQDLPVGRVRANCTAASIARPGRYYWFSKPWFILKEDGSWFPL